jgi:hypothetical protein
MGGTFQEKPQSKHGIVASAYLALAGLSSALHHTLAARYRQAGGYVHESVRCSISHVVGRLKSKHLAVDCGILAQVQLFSDGTVHLALQHVLVECEWAPECNWLGLNCTHCTAVPLMLACHLHC